MIKLLVWPYLALIVICILSTVLVIISTFPNSLLVVDQFPEKKVRMKKRELLNNGIQIEVKERIQFLVEKKDSLFSS